MIRNFFERLHKLEQKHQVLVLVVSSFAIVLFWSAADCLLKRMFCLEESILAAVFAVLAAFTIITALHRTIG